MRKGFGVIPDSMAAIWCQAATNTRKRGTPAYGLPRASGDFATSTRARGQIYSGQPKAHNPLARFTDRHFSRDICSQHHVMGAS